MLRMKKDEIPRTSLDPQLQKGRERGGLRPKGTRRRALTAENVPQELGLRSWDGTFTIARERDPSTELISCPIPGSTGKRN